MSVNFEIKGMLARLLATEDLIVENKKVETACFNVHTRVLTLPMWEKASNTVYDLLLSHEAAHAILTPNEDWTQTHKIPHQFVNICEDVRVEKLMKRRYAGLAKTFYNGYKELHEQDFFSTADDDTSTYNLADRVNLHFKVGNFLKFEFTPEEQEIVDMIGTAETFTEVLDAAEVLYKYCKQKQEEELKISIDSLESQSSGSSSQSASDFTDQEQGENDQQETEGSQNDNQDQGPPQNQQSSTSNQGGEKDEEPEVKTMNSLEEALKQLTSNNTDENVYVEIPKLDVKKIIISNAEIHKNCKDSWNQYIEQRGDSYDDLFGRVDKQFVEFKRSAQKEVNYLVKEFECRKAADSYARATTARTGVLDCSKLHTYKYNEDLFKKVTTLANGKNHGLIFILDWSGSMSNVMLDTVKQLFNLMWFCKKVSIPFEVYAFTSSYPIAFGKKLRESFYTKKEGFFHVDDWFSLMNLFTSKCNARELENQMKNIFRLASAFSGRYAYRFPIPMGMDLSGTPLNETLIALHQILPQFQKENKLQKVQCVILTDGEGQQLKYHKEFNRKWESEPYLGTNGIGANAILRDRKTGNTYVFGENWWDMTNILLRNLRDKFTDINFIGIRVLESCQAGYFIRNYYGYNHPEYEKVMNVWKKEKSFTIKTSGYHSYFGIASNALSQNTQFSVADDATKTQIKQAFIKSLKTKKMNKRILGEFIELIA